MKRCLAAIRVLVLAASASMCASLPCVADVIPDLGAAGNFGVLGLNNASYNITAATTILGNIGIAQGGSVSNAGSVAGTAIENSVGQVTNSGTITGGITISSSLMTSANSGANSAFSAAVANTATQTFGAITTSTTIMGNGGLNTVNIASVNLNGGNITLNGTASDVFVLRVAGNFKLNGNSGILLGTGVSASQVLIVFTGTGTSITISETGGATVNGTLLAPSASTSWAITSGTFVGEIITGTPASGGGTRLNLSNINLTARPFKPIPEPGALVLGGIASVGLVGLIRRNRKSQGRTVDHARV